MLKVRNPTQLTQIFKFKYLIIDQTQTKFDKKIAFLYYDKENRSVDTLQLKRILIQHLFQISKTLFHPECKYIFFLHFKKTFNLGINPFHPAYCP